MLRIVKINVKVLEILYEKLLLLNNYEVYVFSDLLGSYAAEMNIYNQQIIKQFDQLIHDIGIAKQKIENFKPNHSSSQVIKTIAPANVLNKYLFQQESKIERCLCDIITNISMFKCHMDKISKIASICTVKMNRYTDIEFTDVFKLLCNVYLVIRSDFEKMQNKFNGLFQVHRELMLIHDDIGYRNYSLMKVIGQLREESFDTSILVNMDRQLAKSQAVVH